MATIIEVAQHAGVSMKTVSRVLNGEAHVRPHLRARVMSSVEALSYRPNLAARQLAGARSFIIAYPFNNPSPSYITDVLMGAARTCRDRGYHLVSEPVDIGPDATEVIQRLVKTLRPDGIILTPPLADDRIVVDFVEALGVPLVRIAGRDGLYGRSIVVNDHAVSKLMVAHLVDQGHRRIAFIRPPPQHALAQARFDGYLGGLAAAGIAVDDSLIMPGLFDVESGARAAARLLDLPSPPSAIFAANDDMALGAFGVVRSRNLSVPDDVAIAGFDDTPASRLVWPALTTVRQPVRQLGSLAADLLLGGEPSGPVSYELIVRGSTVGA